MKQSPLMSLRSAFGLTQAAVAEVARISRGTVARIETGDLKPTIRTATALSRAFDLSPEEMLRFLSGQIDTLTGTARWLGPAEEVGRVAGSLSDDELAQQQSRVARFEALIIDRFVASRASLGELDVVRRWLDDCSDVSDASDIALELDSMSENARRAVMDALFQEAKKFPGENGPAVLLRILGRHLG